ncbi:extracellular solute-binding protein [Paenibacillus nasutitermitis]|uniref:ABC transporter peptide-binding protein YtcQ n=1 Tax=Paenibacillus nasutitermitis TaxID=1652958 RepID=A0A916YK42_9BACL|nr:extracellular solute-binding protein [Paenibacillus nasutitermitis]GGD47016.1 putative ABC transporter peptide-binding protein YtcQ [Paenibacillus nasutitermitis]
MTRQWGKQSKMKVGGLILTALVLLSSACSNGGSNTGSSSTSGDKGGEATSAPTPLKLKLMTPYFNAEPPKQDSDAMKIIKEFTNADLEVMWVPGSAYTDKLNASIAGQDLPEVVMARTGSNSNSAFVNAVRSGMFWEIGPYLKDYPNLNAMLSDLEANTLIDGKMYGIRKYFPQARDGIIYRKDWLDKLGLEEPKTVEEVIKVARAFTTQDPDGNGRNDTFGFGVTSGVAGFSLFNSWYGGANRWEFKEGQMVPDHYSDAYLQTMKLYKEFYDENIINQDFPVFTNGFDLLNKGKAGMYLGPLDDLTVRFGDLAKSNPDAVLDVIGRVEGPGGARVATMGTLPTLFVFPKTSVKTEERLKQVLGFMDKMADPQMQDLFVWGIEGVHYQLKDGKPERTDASKFTADFSDLDMIRYDEGNKAREGNMPDNFLKAKQAQIDNLAIAVPNPAQSLISDTNIEKGSEIGKIISDARTKFIIGELDEAGWKSAIESWKKNGGEQIIKEFTEEYLKYYKE